MPRPGPGKQSWGTSFIGGGSDESISAKKLKNPENGDAAAGEALARAKMSTDAAQLILFELFI